MLSVEEQNEGRIVDLGGGELLAGSGFEDEPEDAPEVAPAVNRGTGIIPSAEDLAKIGSLRCFQDVDADEKA